jgi:hypothetical protein
MFFYYPFTSDILLLIANANATAKETILKHKIDSKYLAHAEIRSSR